MTADARLPGLKLYTYTREGVTIERRRIARGNASVTYEVAGTRGEPVVLVHGLSGSSDWWRWNIAALARNHRVFAVNLFRFGGSHGAGSFVLTEAAEYLVDFLDAVGLERAHFVGHSMGGFICSDLAAQHPDRVDRLVLANAAALPFNHGYVRQAFGLAQAARYLSPRFLVVLAQDALTAGPLTLAGAAWQLLNTDITEKLRHIEASTLVVWGMKDTVVPYSVAEGLKANIPRLEFAPIPDAGHNPMWDRPDAFNRFVLDFLGDEVPADAPAVTARTR